MSIVDRQFDSLYRSVDDVGNLYETKEKKDRVYGAGSRLLETKDAKFSYDEEGNLVEKVEKNGDTWKYEYYSNGMMAKVIKPDNTEVTFKYDSLGRRIEKRSDEKIMRFVWDGNTILHEYSENDSAELEKLVKSQNKSEIPGNLVTWVFNEGFVPSAKITSEGHYSIISDYLGTPVEAYDEQGHKVWSAELDVYGRMKEFTGEKDFIPFRYQGQYEDVEIGLYYNRFRYYDPEQGNYIQIDPIGLAGGNPTLYGYVQDPNMENDPFGLARAPSQVLAGNRKKAGDKISGFQAHHVITTNTWKTHQSFFDSIGMGGLRDEAFNGIMMPSNPTTLKGSSFSMIHNTSHPMYSDYVMSRVTDISDQYSLGLINEKEARTDIRKLQVELKNKIQEGYFDTVQSRKYPKCQRLG